MYSNYKPKNVVFGGRKGGRSWGRGEEEDGGRGAKEAWGRNISVGS